MRRQPRVYEKKQGNYNFEQFSRYTQMFNSASKIDNQKSERFYKMTKYVKENIDDKVDPFVHKYVEVDGLRPDLVTIPEEFKDLDTEDLVKEKAEGDFSGRKPSSNRRIIRQRTDKSLVGYDSWRCHDRVLMKGSGKAFAVAKLMIAPAALVRAFGMPSTTEIFYDGTGEYNFEDSNLDLYCLYDYRQTDFYYGLNREDEYYETKRNLKRPLHKRKMRRPTIQEFWESEEPKEFKLSADDQAQYRKFKRWLRKHLDVHGLPDAKPFDQIQAEKFKDEVQIHLGDYKEPSVINTKMAVHQWDFTYFLNEEELKKLKPEEKPEEFEVPKHPDMATAERIFISKEQIKMEEIEKEK